MMGTNFYVRDRWIVLPPDVEPGAHLGKRSAAGPYCWDCDLTLCRGGPAQVHAVTTPDKWWPVCPRCGQAPQAVGRAADVELGFARPDVRTRPTGVRSVASWSWALAPELVGTLCRQFPDVAWIEDEYGDTYTGQAFLDLLAHCCPLQYTHSVGTEFS